MCVHFVEHFSSVAGKTLVIAIIVIDTLIDRNFAIVHPRQFKCTCTIRCSANVQASEGDCSQLVD
jgi:hypothetical protein